MIAKFLSTLHHYRVYIGHGNLQVLDPDIMKIVSDMFLWCTIFLSEFLPSQIYFTQCHEWPTVISDTYWVFVLYHAEYQCKGFAHAIVAVFRHLKKELFQ